MNLARLWTIVTLELTQRVRSVAWYVLLGVFAAILLGVTALSFLAFSWMGGSGPGAGGAIYSVIVYVVLLLVVLVSPTVAGNAVNGDRDQATLAPVQVTLATTGEIVLGKLVAAWVSGLAFLAVAVPFLAVATIAGGLSPAALAVSLLVLVIEIGVFAAIGVGLSALLARPLFSIASTYLVVAAFVIGTLIVFGLGGAAVRTEVESHSRYITYEGSGTDYACSGWETYTYEVPRFDRVWWVLAANPFVIIADATPTAYDAYGNPTDLFGQIASGVRMAQVVPETETWSDGCADAQDYPSVREQTDGLLPSWFVGLGVQLVVAGLLLWGGWARTRTPARRLPPGTRVA
ncbi:ABC transporter permease [Microbacterium sp. 18062]|uniref:ABC transporter permease n=1 Tax=Microbacterium sp. 18062 TaxID=2681410 RepID=UPI001357FFB7|nr:ABC transporter permease [Microbacterium sp. 18062]